MVGHGGSSAGSYLADPTSPIPSHCASIVTTSTLRVNQNCVCYYIRGYLAGAFSMDVCFVCLCHAVRLGI